MRKVLGLMVPATVLLAACGGGGGGGPNGDGTLYVSLNYPAVPAMLFDQTSLVPVQEGFEGHTPNCSLAGGSLPPGMAVNPDCSVSGRPTQHGVWTFTIRVSAAGVSNTVEMPRALTVVAPEVSYPVRYGPIPVRVGEGVSDAPSFGNWRPSAGLTWSMNYQQIGGALPPGFTLDPATGQVSGVAQAGGSHSALIQPTLTTPYGSYQPTHAVFSLSVDVPTVTYSAMAGEPVVAYLGEAFNASPLLLAGMSLSNVNFGGGLPPGLSATGQGVVSGTPIGPLKGESSHHLNATLQHNGVSVSTHGSLRLSLRSPVRYEYSPGDATIEARVNVPLSRAPMEIAVDGRALSPTATRAYSAGSPCGLMPGLVLNPVTGTISGTPTSSGYLFCRVQVDITDNGASWSEAADFWHRVIP